MPFSNNYSTYIDTNFYINLMVSKHFSSFFFVRAIILTIKMFSIHFRAQAKRRKDKKKVITAEGYTTISYSVYNNISLDVFTARVDNPVDLNAAINV